jgi:hypothetical protein
MEGLSSGFIGNEISELFDKVRLLTNYPGM